MGYKIYVESNIVMCSECHVVFYNGKDEIIKSCPDCGCEFYETIIE